MLDEVICNLKKDIVEFFKLPLETKKAYSQLPNGLEGYGQVFDVSEKQKMDWADMFYLVARPNEARDMLTLLSSHGRFRPDTTPGERHDGPADQEGRQMVHRERSRRGAHCQRWRRS